MIKYLILLTLVGCSTTPEYKPTGGYLTSDDPIQLECVDGVVWVFNNSGRISLESECDE